MCNVKNQVGYQNVIFIILNFNWIWFRMHISFVPTVELGSSKLWFHSIGFESKLNENNWWPVHTSGGIWVIRNVLTKQNLRLDLLNVVEMYSTKFIRHRTSICGTWTKTRNNNLAFPGVHQVESKRPTQIVLNYIMCGKGPN